MRCFLFLLPNLIHGYAIITCNSFDEREVLHQKYSPPLILPSPHFWWVVSIKIRSPAHAVTDWVYFPEAPGSPRMQVLVPQFSLSFF